MSLETDIESCKIVNKQPGIVPIGSKDLLGCGVCGGKTAKIRGRHPGDNAREVCPTCLAERMDMINEMSSAHYGMACEAQPNVPAQRPPATDV